MTLPTEFQKLMDLNLANMNSVIVCIEDIQNVTKGIEHDHLSKVNENFK